MKGRRRRKGFIIRVYNAIITEKRGAESELNRRDDKRIGTGQRELSIQTLRKFNQKASQKPLEKV